MVKKDFIRLYAETYGTDEATARQIIENVFCLVLTAVEKEKILKINQFGTFESEKPRKEKSLTQEEVETLSMQNLESI